MNHLMPAIRTYIVLTLLLGLIYPVAITGLGQALFAKRARGSLIEIEGKVVGSSLIAQKFEMPKYFWPRPSSIDFNPLASGGSNLGPTSQALKDAVQGRQAKLGALPAPQGLLFASASGLDPHIDLDSAIYQIPRIAQARGMPVEEVRSTVLSQLEKRDLGFLGEERVNVLKLNLALDQRK
jgi:K+-transporting ATPase ATPase C chain